MWDFVDNICCGIMSIALLLFAINCKIAGEHIAFVILGFVLSAIFAIPHIKYIYKSIFNNIKGDGDNEKR